MGKGGIRAALTFGPLRDQAPIVYKSASEDSLMHTQLTRIAFLTVVFLFLPGNTQAADPATKSKLDVLTMKGVPDGHYLVNLKMSGREQRVNVLVRAGGGELVKATQSQLVGGRGRFELIGNGVFVIFFENDSYRATLFWVFNSDGTALVKEVPDEGQRQIATPVKTDSLEPPALSSP